MNPIPSFLIRARTVLRAGLLAALVLPATLPLVAQTGGKEQLTVALSAPGKPGVLHVKLVGGSITVVGYGGKDVVVDIGTQGRQRDKDDDDDAAGSENRKGLKRISSSSGFDLTAEEKSNHVYVSTNSWQQAVALTIKVPQRFSLQISTVQDGDILVENVAGELEVSNVNGDVRLSQVSGSAVASTVNGDVTASFRSVTAGAPMAFSTVNGKIDVTLPSTTKAALKLKTDNGEIYSDFDLTADKTPPTVNRTSKGGVYRLNVDNWTYGKLNGGGAEIMMKTLQDDIYIRKAK
ncbi:DUF4097 family beta strand repeat-containing protein [Hymenobacter elongatus]|uniref:DUF4097 domain-containing protein n=1 Tax=Hymenobacter elongatus TaxID=877208 RepID=A0A4Z0PSM9_9BACT|nr:DUF4097 family beta strand repeat-containing protein [Hymenobacter elongatus]TGE20011.1 hypothetical protein E5J99_00130 [Hymenobacter elongatus]